MGNVEKFNMIAGQYDTPERAATAKIIADFLRAHLHCGIQKTAIDYGCGTGLVGLNLLGALRSLLFIDASESMISALECKLAALGAKNAAAQCCDLLSGPHAAEICADYVFVVQTLLHVKDVDAALARFYAMLHPGGHLLLVDFDRNDAVQSDEVHCGFSQRDLVRRVQAAGFVNVEAHTFYYGEKMFMNQDASLFLLDAEKPA